MQYSKSIAVQERITEHSIQERSKPYRHDDYVHRTERLDGLPLRERRMGRMSDVGRIANIPVQILNLGDARSHLSEYYVPFHSRLLEISKAPSLKYPIFDA